MKSRLPRALGALVLALLGTAMVAGELVLGSGAVVAQATEDEGPLMQRLRELRRPDGSVDAPYGTGQPEELAIQNAYEHYTATVVDAVARANDSRLTESLGGRRLEQASLFIQQLRQGNKLLESEIQSIAPLAYVELTPERAIIYVQYRYRQRELDAATGVVLGEQTAEIRDAYYLLEPSDGTWKVTDAA